MPLQGVFLTFEPTAQGGNHLTRIRFNRQHYSREQAQLWWQEHRMEIAHHYQLITDNSSAASTSDPSASPRYPPRGFLNLQNLHLNLFE